MSLMTSLAYVNGRRMQRKGSFKKKSNPLSGKSKITNNNEDAQDVHSRNIRLFAQPIVLLFNLLRFLAFQLWVVLCGSALHTKDLKESLPSQQAKSEDKCKINITEMAHRQPGIGPGEPVLVAQKKHHRKAFEYISKALKIDEDEKGKTIHNVSQCATKRMSDPSYI